MRDLVLALAGNPNSGKSTIFNVLTGGKQHVGNWPGKTVERREGRAAVGDVALRVVDFPGTYSLAALSPEESVARDYLLEGHPDVVAVVIDAANAERNLYLAVQILELGIPTVLALNMSDVVDASGVQIDRSLMSERLGAPVVRTVARRGEGIPDLLAAAVAAVGSEVS